MFVFGTRSIRRWGGVNSYLVECAKRALSKSRYDMTIPWMGGVRTTEEQGDLFLDGVTKADGIKNLSYHQSGNALDVKPVGTDGYKKTRAFNHFAKLMFQEWQEMIYEGNIDGRLYWGGHFGKSGWDKPHWEIRER